MNNQPFNQPPRPLNNQLPRRVGKARPAMGIPWPLLSVVLIVHGVVGLLLSVFSPPYWVWPLAFGGTLIQSILLAGPKALSSLTGGRVLLSRWATCLGTALSVVALAIAVGYGGTSDIDAIQFFRISLAIFFTNVGVLLLTAICSLLIAHAGDRMLTEMGRTRCSLTVLSFCFFGMFIGGVLGLAIATL
ncbi:hypothetical protein [Leptothoe sp. PORK10 BA2]|uniref:hypothetical protein n=1 Tax=Leptothoe sp. PORK10 BA2 TaxID=3110254 RepID=UPI002B1F2FAA|nr:hypothetical protein [Leptothoe sp. PORK10 BA2]MEA5466571.1 hypothetical protein [Leptothoe sp. PORK10 BA2]